MRFVKLHGAGNDYLFIDARRLDKDWPALARAMSDRHFGVGADGIILALQSEEAQVRMRMFNADGSEGEMCGNGIRCFGRFVLDEKIATLSGESLAVETEAGVLSVTPLFENGKMARARVSMGEPRLQANEIPVDLPGLKGRRVYDYPIDVGQREFAISCVSMGNPHAVTFLDEPVDQFPLETIGPRVEHLEMFPNRVNFEIVNVLSPSHIRARVWERGSGITLACGTGACAVAVASYLHGYTGECVDITLPGGFLKVEWPGHGDVILEGPVEEVFQGEWPE